MENFCLEIRFMIMGITILFKRCNALVYYINSINLTYLCLSLFTELSKKTAGHMTTKFIEHILLIPGKDPNFFWGYK